MTTNKLIFKDYLKKWRMEEAHKYGFAHAPYIICSDKTLEDAINKLPNDKNSLYDIYGFGDSKVDKHGNSLLKAIAKFSTTQKTKVKNSNTNLKDSKTFDFLKEWRSKEAIKHGYGRQPYLICNNQSLEQIAGNMPDSKSTLLEVRGFGPEKVNKYGPSLIKALKTFQSANSNKATKTIKRKVKDLNINISYKSICDDLKKYKNLNTKDFNNYLINLQEPTKRLWRSYRNNNVTVDYSSELIQSSYMLRYYNLYFKSAYNFFTSSNLYKINRMDKSPFIKFNVGGRLDRIINILKDNSNTSKERTLKILFIGSGPCPEITAFLKSLVDKDKEGNIYAKGIKNIIIDDVDIYANKWNYSRKINAKPTFNKVKKYLTKLNIKLSWNTFNSDLRNYMFTKDRYDMIYTQNFLNEIISDKNTKKQEFYNFLDNHLSKSGLFLTNDRLGYREVDEFLANDFTNNKYDNIFCTSSIIKDNKNVDSRLLENLYIDQPFTNSQGLVMSKTCKSRLNVFIKRN